MKEKYRIHEIGGDWALDVPLGEAGITLYFNSQANANLVKAILKWEDAHPNEAAPYPIFPKASWKHYLPPLGAGNVQSRCSSCGLTPDVETPFCPFCGAPMTDEAVMMLRERILNQCKEEEQL